MFKRIQALFAPIEKRAASGFDALLFSAPTASGVSVTAESALRSTAVFGAIRVLAESTASLPLHLYRRLPDGGRERADDHPIYPLITDAPNPWTAASEFRLGMQTALSLHGNAYAFVNRVGGTISEIIALDSRTVTVETDAATMEPVYQVTAANGSRRAYSRAEILHIRGIGIRPNVGVSPVEMAREAIGLGLVLEQHGAGLFGRGARPAGILTYGKTLTDEVVARLRKSFEALHGGGANGGRTAILEDGIEFKPLQLSSVDAQFIELRKFQLQEIARVWRVPLHLLGDLDRTTHSNAEEMGAQFLSYCLLPILRLWQDALKLTLLTPDERRELFFEFNVDDLARADLSARFAAYSQAISAGILNPNEIRAMENRAPYAGGEVWMRPVNTAPAPTANTAGDA